jgi:hypothetical protein
VKTALLSEASVELGQVDFRGWVLFLTYAKAGGRVNPCTWRYFWRAKFTPEPQRPGLMGERSEHRVRIDQLQGLSIGVTYTSSRMYCCAILATSESCPVATRNGSTPADQKLETSAHVKAKMMRQRCNTTPTVS